MKASRPLLALVLYFFSLSINGQIVINEWMASNESFIADDFGEFDDWIEIYNTSGSTFDLSGHYISDDETDLTKWQIPTDSGIEVQIPANGYLILWADNDGDQGATHLEFKLSGGGESIIVVAPDGTTIIDQVSFPAQGSDVSYGRFPDADPNLEFFPTPTPGATNVSGGNIAVPFELIVPLNQSSDDANEFFGTMGLTKPLLNIGQDNATSLSAGLRFTNIAVDKSATITESFIQFTAYNDQSAVADYTLQMGTDIFPETHTTDNSNITSRNFFPTTIPWSVEPWTTGEVTEKQRTPNLAPLVSEWINQSNWESGANAYFNIEGSGQRDADSFDGNTEGSAKFIVRGTVEIPDVEVNNIYINEVAAAGTTFLDEAGDPEDWVELYNNSGEIINTTGLYLTDDKGDLDKWNLPFGRTIEPNGFITFFLDDDTEEGSDHANFKIESKGDWLGLVQQTTSGFRIIDSLSWENMPFQATYGRFPDGDDNLQFFGEITPAASNNGALSYLSPPNIDLESGIYSGTQTTTITHPDAAVDIYYTLDGEVPNATSTLYNGTITITENSALRAIAIKAGFAPSLDANKAYLIDEDLNIPALFMTTAPNNFFDDEIGIYVVGTNGITDGCVAFPANFAQDWERPANLKMILPDGVVAFDENVGVKITGACSRNFPMKSLAINLREQLYGDGKIEYPIFSNRENNDDFFRLKLRNSGQDFSRLGFRDLLNQRILTGKLDVETQAGQPTMLFLNGEFWGIYNIREKYTKYYFNENKGTSLNKVNIVKSPGLPYADVKEGTDAEFNVLFDWMQTADLSDQSQFDNFANEVDVNEFINYWSVMTFMANCDFPNNNITVWKERKAGKKWRYGIADTDCSTHIDFTAAQLSYQHFNTLEAITDPVNITPPYNFDAVLFLRKAFENEAFYQEFAQRTCSIMDIIYNSDSVTATIDETVELFTPNAARHIARWDGVDPAYSVMGGSIIAWEGWINEYRGFYLERPGYMREHIADKFGFGENYELTFNVDAETKGSVVVNWNEMEVPFNHKGTYFQNIPLTVKAIANQGFEFVRWDETGVTNAEIQFVSGADASLTPIFEATCIEGDACDDGDACTEEDVFDANCGCFGTFADDDNDTVCNAEDQCPGFDDLLDDDGDGVPNDCETDSVLELNDLVFNLFPNPSNGNTTIALQDATDFPVNMELRNALGQIMEDALFTRVGDKNIEVSCSSCENGLYFLKLENEKAMRGISSWLILK